MNFLQNVFDREEKFLLSSLQEHVKIAFCQLELLVSVSMEAEKPQSDDK